MDLGRLLEGFWMDLASKLGGKLGPSWHQNLKHEGPKMMSKKVMNKNSCDKFQRHPRNSGSRPLRGSNPGGHGGVQGQGQGQDHDQWDQDQDQRDEG